MHPREISRLSFDVGQRLCALLRVCLSIPARRKDLYARFRVYIYMYTAVAGTSIVFQCVRGWRGC